MKPYRFFFHYNKPESLRAMKPKVTVHFKNKCHVVDNIVCYVPTEGKIRNSQPRFVVQGFVKESEFRITDGVAYIGA